jgi:hypothetical protein
MGAGNGEDDDGGKPVPQDAPPPSIDDDETAIIAWFHRDTADALDALSVRSRRVADIVVAVGLDAARPFRIELRRNIRLTVRLLDLAFSDLDI